MEKLIVESGHRPKKQESCLFVEVRWSLIVTQPEKWQYRKLAPKEKTLKIDELYGNQ